MITRPIVFENSNLTCHYTTCCVGSRYIKLTLVYESGDSCWYMALGTYSAWNSGFPGPVADYTEGSDGNGTVTIITAHNHHHCRNHHPRPLAHYHHRRREPPPPPNAITTIIHHFITANPLTRLRC